MTINRVDLFQFIYGTAAEIAAETGVPYRGEPVFSWDTGALRIGNGTTAANALAAIGGGGGDALVSGTLDQFANVTQTAGQTLAITSSTTLAGGTHSGTNSGDQTNVSGNAGTATVAATVAVADTTDSTCFVGLFESATGSLAAMTDGGLTYNATTGVLTATGFSGPLAGNVNGTVGATTPAAGTFTSLQTTGNAVIDGDLTVSGTTFTVDTATYQVEDPLIKLGKANAGDAVDLGWYAPYVSAGTKYTGLFRDATDGKFRLFVGLQSEPTTTVDIGGAGYAAAILVASLEGNATTVTTNANLTGPITSAGNATAVAAQTGTGTTFVMQASPTLTTPVIGVALATSVRTTEVTSTPAGTTQTITLANGNHQTLALTSATGTVTATITVPGSSSAGTIIVKQHASAAKDITWAVSAGSIVWLGTEPDWGADAVSKIRVLAWRFDGTDTYLSSTDTN